MILDPLNKPGFRIFKKRTNCIFRQCITIYKSFKMAIRIEFEFFNIFRGFLCIDNDV